MKKSILTILLLLCSTCVYSSPLDVVTGVNAVSGVVTGAVITKTATDNSKKVSDAIVRNIDAQTENIKKGGGLQIVRQPDGSAKVYQNGIEVKTNADPNSPEYKMGLKMAESMSNYFERKDAKAKLKEIQAVAKIENDTETLAIIKKYKKAGAVVTLKKLEEQKANQAKEEK